MWKSEIVSDQNQDSEPPHLLDYSFILYKQECWYCSHIVLLGHSLYGINIDLGESYVSVGVCELRIDRVNSMARGFGKIL